MDRLAQFQAACGLILLGGVPAPGSGTLVPARVTVTEPPSEQSLEAAQKLQEFYKLVGDVGGAVDRVTTLTREIAAKHSAILSNFDVMKSDSMRQEVEELTSQINASAQAASQTLEAMKAETDKLKVTPEMESLFVGVIRIEENQRRYMLHRLSEAMEAYQRQQNLVEAQYRTMTERQIKIKYTNPDGTAIDDETAKELAQAVLENNVTSGIFQQSKDVLAQIIETRNDIYHIERSMRYLNQLFNDLAFLVHEQGEIMDVVLKNIESTTQFVEAGRKEMRKARKYKKRSRRKICCLVIILAVVVALFVLAAVLGKVL
ncbi:putative target SNARE [Trypanosoma conorhini]|uniref:Putative target SNARE n=1 Tax=Trypanosoma conorhini TaxID=83891 RepID=A0A422P9G1_9TRYP|nr:putative target SNARE [Trypanosoma conorhini]RNF14355.1 putative target SNARE [Trypanosoma conorhini]